MKFKAKIWKFGHSYVITVPKVFIKNDMVKINKKLIINIKDENKNNI